MAPEEAVTRLALIPPGYRAGDVLTDGPAGRRVLRASDPEGREVVLRVEAGGLSDEIRAELAVLAGLDEPGIARLFDHGALPGGGRYLAREWIDGERLDAWARGRASDEIGRALVRACLALEALHRRGFVHGDLKAENLIVVASEDGPRAVLTDFGLAHRVGRARSAVAGSYFHIAPELLAGGAPGAPSDLFALGVLLQRLLLATTATAERFHARFPAEDYFAASETRAEDLPEWARDLVPALLERDPALRPASAVRVARMLAERLGVALDASVIDERPRWPAALGRESWLEELGERATPGRALWVLCPTGTEARELAAELALRAALAGRAVRRVEPERELAGAQDTRALDARARAMLEMLGGVLAIACLEADALWGARALDQLARLLAAGTSAAVGAPALIVLAVEPPADEPAWMLERAPAVGAERVRERLREWLGRDERTERLAALVAEAGGGSATGLERALAAAARLGLIVSDERGLRHGPAPLPARLTLELSGAERLAELDQAGLALVAALTVSGGPLELARAAELIGSPEAFARGLDSARAHVAHDAARGSLALREAPAPAALAERLGETAWRGLHAGRAAQLSRQGAPPARVLPHRWHAGLATIEDLLEESRLSRERGCPELALDLVRAALEPEPRDASEAARLRAEAAHAWCALGAPERALELVRPLAAEDRPSAQRALAELVEAEAASVRHEPLTALEHLEAARALGAGSGELALARARLLWELRRDDEVLALASEALGGEVDPSSRQGANLRAIAAMSRFRAGDVERARGELEDLLGEARIAGDAPRESGLRIDLGTLERRSGARGRALEQFRQAAEHYDRAGHLPGLAQARALEGGTLREAGALERAEPLLASALELRARLGDRAGADAVRGMLGLLRADRGHVRSALQDLDASAVALLGRGRSTEAALLEGRASELRARLGPAPLEERVDGARGRRESLAEGDPRILLSRARARWLAGEREEASQLFARARELATRIGHSGVIAEAALGEALLAGRAPDEHPGESSATSADAHLAALLAHAPFDAKEAGRLAEELASCGRDDRAARLFLALAVRGGESTAEAYGLRFETLLGRCARGCTTAETDALAEALLGLPDPWPEDLAAWRARRRERLAGEDDLERLLEINRGLLSQEDLPTLLGAIVEQALEVSGAQRGFLVLERDGELAVDTALESRRGDVDPSEVELSGSLLREALGTMEPLRIASALDDPRLAAAPSVLALELRSVLCVPFSVREGLRGAIWVDHRLREHAFDERAEHVLDLLAGQAALAIRQVERIDEIRRLNRELKREVERQVSELRSARRALREASVPAPASGLVGDSPTMRRVHRLIERAGPGKLPLLVVGRSGTGKELAARALHAASERVAGPFVSENCAALPPTLIEAELFGVRRGAFTGAERDREGLFERAHGGTLFLDEIGELPLELQAKLLRVLETGEVRRLGDDRMRAVDFRLVAATNRDLGADVRDKRFRADLFYRLDGLRVEMPALAERVEDIPLLVDHYLRLRTGPDEEPRRISGRVLERLSSRAWPGNVRELFNEIERLCVLCEGELDEPELVRAPELSLAAPEAGRVRPLADLEREAIEHAIEVAGGDKRSAADLLGISRATIYERLKRWREAQGPNAD